MEGGTIFLALGISLIHWHPTHRWTEMKTSEHVISYKRGIFLKIRLRDMEQKYEDAIVDMNRSQTEKQELED